MIKSTLLLSLLVFSAGCANAQSKEVNKNTTIESNQPVHAETVGAGYRVRYPLTNAYDKIVNDGGKGDPNLYGVRNFRSVLNGVYYRGGANNLYFAPKRGNMNPLPDTGLDNLCKEGFTQAVYFYNTNFASAPKSVKCRTYDGAENTLSYLQISPLAYRLSDLRKLHGMIYDRVRDSHIGPMYGHCWNGWHASGYVAATALRQFCGFTADEAVAYWNRNTDGNHGSAYDKLRGQIRAFVPSPDMMLSPEEKTALCPNPTSLAFQ